MYLEERDRLVEVIDKGRRRKVSRGLLTVVRMLNDSAKGDAKARSDVIKLESLFGADDPLLRPSATQPGDDGLQDERDLEVLAGLKEWLVEQKNGIAADPESGSDDQSAPAGEEHLSGSGSDAENGSSGAATTKAPGEASNESPGQPEPDGQAEHDDEPVTFDRPLRAFRNGEWT